MKPWDFLSTAICDPNVGAVAPTSTNAVRFICKRLPTDRPLTVVEYGPGTGVFTRYLVENLHPESLVLAVETNEKFTRDLQEMQRSWKSRGVRLVVACDDARNVLPLLRQHAEKPADFAISGIPFSFLEQHVRREIVSNTHEALTDEGQFWVYQYSFQMTAFLAECFVEVRKQRLLANLPPLCLMTAGKQPLPHPHPKTKATAHRPGSNGS